MFRAKSLKSYILHVEHISVWTNHRVSSTLFPRATRGSCAEEF